MVEKNMKEEEESGIVEERRAREQLGEGVEVGIHSFKRSVGSYKLAQYSFPGHETSPNLAMACS